jgi:hypothetical protein
MLSKNELYVEYVEKRKEVKQIAEENNCCDGSVYNWLRKFGIKLRDEGDLTGRVFGRLTAISVHSIDKFQHRRWNCKCSCGVDKVVLASSLVRGITKSCGCLTYENRKEVYNWKGFGDIHHSYWLRLKKGSKRRGIDFNISIEDAWKLFEKQNRKCALTGELLVFADTIANWKLGKCTASLDRINSSQGYIEGNIQWVHKDINKMKSDWDQITFVELCRKVVEHKRNP